MTEKEYYKSIGSKIAQLIKKAGLNQNEVAKRIGISPSVISEAINDGKKLSAFRINQILEILGYETTITEKNLIHTLELPDANYQELLQLLAELENDPQYEKYRETVKKLTPS